MDHDTKIQQNLVENEPFDFRYTMSSTELVPAEGKTSFSGIPESQFIDDVDNYMKVISAVGADMVISDIHLLDPDLWDRHKNSASFRSDPSTQDPHFEYTFVRMDILN